MTTERFVYVTYIRTTQQKLWDALTKPEFVKQYWFGMTQDCAWTKGASWSIKFEDGRTADSGELLEIDPPHRLVLKWRNEFKPEIHAEGYSRAQYLLEPQGDMVKLTVTHEIDAPRPSKFIESVSNGWPMILSNLKSLLETGKAFERPAA